MDDRGILDSRPGFRYFAELVNPASEIFEYLQLPLILDGTTLRYSDSLGVLTDWTGSYSPPTGERMRGIETDGKWLFLTDEGPFIQESPTSTPRRAGMPQGLDIQLVESGDGLGGFFQPDSQIGYKVCFGKGNLAPGAPSFAEIIGNAKTPVTLTKSGTTVTVTGHTAHGYTNGDTIWIYDPVDVTYIAGPHVIAVTGPDAYTYTVSVEPTGEGTTGTDGKVYKIELKITIPGEVQTGWWCEIYRTFMSASFTAEPFDYYYRVIRYTITGTDIANGYITYTDTRDDDYLKLELHTNPTQEGQAGSNDRPPYAKFLSAFRGHVFYGNIRREEQLTIQLLDYASLTLGDTFNIYAGGLTWTYTAATAESHGAKEYKLWTTEVIPSVNTRKTAKSLCHIINNDATCPVYAHYPWTDVGQIILIRRDLLPTKFSLTATGSGTPGLAWSPNLPTSGVTIISDPNTKPYQVARSKFQKPECCPTLATNEVGQLTLGINGMISLKDSMLIFSPGAWELTGETDGAGGKNFTVRELDLTIKLLRSDSLVALDNSAFGWFDQGICRISSAGSAIVSRQLEEELKQITQFDTFDQVFCIAYESFHKLLVFYPSTWASTYCDRVFVYDYLGNCWSGPWEKEAACGVVLPSSSAGKLYLGRADQAKVSVERKTFIGNEDYVDEDDPATVTAFGTSILNGLTVSYVTVAWTGEALGEGWLFCQGSYQAIVSTATDNLDGTWILVLRVRIYPVAGAATLAAPVGIYAIWIDDAAGNPSAMKLFGPAIFSFRRDFALTHEIGFSSDTVDGISWQDKIRLTQTCGFGAEWGREWGDPGPAKIEPLDVPVPADHARCRRLFVHYRHFIAKERVEIIQMSVGAKIYSDKVSRLPA